MPRVLERVSVVVPTIGRPSLDALLDALASATGPRPAELILVDDRPAGSPLRPGRPGLPPVRVVRTGGGGPARARNLGWRTAATEWVAFLDDDVVPDPDWYERLDADLADLPADVAGSQGRVRVPLPDDRRPTDWEHGTAGLATSSWITADLAYRRAALTEVGGLDERFPRAFREDSDLALRVLDTGKRLVRGERRITHPVRPASRGWRPDEHEVRRWCRLVSEGLGVTADPTRSISPFRPSPRRWPVWPSSIQGRRSPVGAGRPSGLPPWPGT